MAMIKEDEALMGAAGDSHNQGETNVDGRGKGRGGRDKEIDVKILARPPKGQLQPTPPAAATCRGREEDKKEATE